jgi:hypothetical protein
MPLIKFFSKSFSDMLEHKFGKEYKKKLLNDYIHQAARSSFSRWFRC